MSKQPIELSFINIELKFVCTCDLPVDITNMKYNENKLEDKCPIYSPFFLQTLPGGIHNYHMVILLAKQIQPDELK